MHAVVLLHLLRSIDHVSPCQKTKDNIVKEAFGGRLVSKVDYVQEDLVVAEQAYILFYAKKSTP
ncbi:hypothetical protein KY290_033650 [Solanum tuberosum]|uniref:Uncharacterized protein n=1 Tax=Solanum tuberosum TaxID=4113 RepID=A0ABQ7U0Y1_SOLTU|nr:hypothetical protein KY289_033021 [Solanum tuberosum]KAH0740607.1 hypothetical protein KY290_033650 [Solanum tuberosum]